MLRIFHKLHFYLFICFALLMFSCSSEKKTQLKEVVIGTFSRAIDYSPFYVAKHFKWFEENELLKSTKITFREFNDRETFATLLSNNELHVIFAAEPPLIITRAQGIKIKLTDVSCTLQQEIVVRNELSINSVNELKEKKIAVLAGTSSHYGLLKILKKNNISTSDVDIQFMGPVEARSAFENNQIDGWAVWPPFVEEQQVSGKGKVLSGGDAIIQSVMAMPEYMFRDYDEISMALVSVIQKAKAWILEHPEESISIVSKELGIENEIVKTAWPKHKWDATFTEDLLADIQAKATFLANEKATRNNVIVNVKDEFINSKYINE